ncbi:uncharacterized protein BXZ73DRAFT_93801 [Epithele typhae]|uniref:uncharacterized protein n=1 Tax=Epithele typhae TaxID=378194 RepID=UPI0020086DE6|nr:uncharacterized protein BXZ73DRAFT_93801 [Epithele typhae]KAH9910400.1 hypothetical protein BXZ73DRAFT_93801 [Epithele typhae]
MLLSSTGGSSRRASVTNGTSSSGTFNLKLPDVFSDAREHGYRGPTRHVRLPRATSTGGGAIAKGEDPSRCVVAGRESLRILRMSETGLSSPSGTEHKSVTGRGGHRIDASRNYWEGSGLKVDSSSTDVVWCHGAFSNKILTGARNGELIMWDLNKGGSSKYERRIRDHARAIHALQYSPILQSYCMSGSADGDVRVWDIRDLSKSIMRIHHPAPVRAVAFSPVSSQSRHIVVALENGSIHRWDLKMGQRGQLDRIPVAHQGPILTLDWAPPSSLAVPTPPRPSGASTWYGGPGGFFEEMMPSMPIGSGPPTTPEGENTGPAWIVSGGMDRCVKVWDLSSAPTRHAAYKPAYSLYASFPVRRVCWRPGYDCELAIVSNADFGSGSDFGHGALSGPTSSSGSLSTMMHSPRISATHLAGGLDGARTPDERSRSVAASTDDSDPVEIWDVRRGYIAKWIVGGSAAEGSVTDLEFADSHALWALHSSGTFSQLDTRQSRRPIDAIPRSAISWNSTGSIAFVTDKPRRWEIPYDDVDSDTRQDNTPHKTLGDPRYRPTTQNVGAFVHDGAAEDLDTIAKLARGYVYTGESKSAICAHNCIVAERAAAWEAAQTWYLLESLLTEIIPPPTPPLSPLPFVTSPPLPHSNSAPAAIPTVHSVPQTPAPHRASTSGKDRSPGSLEGKQRRSTSGHRSAHGTTPTSSNASSPRKSSIGLPSVPAAIFARRESGAGLPTPLRPLLPPSFRRPSFSTQSFHSTQSETTSEGVRGSHKQYGEGALDDSDSDESGSEDGDGDDPDGDEDKDGDGSEPPHTPASSGSRSPFPHPGLTHRASIAHPSPLSRLAVSPQTWTEDEKDDSSSPSPRSTSDDSDDGDDGFAASRRPSALRMVRRESARSRTRSRSSTVASFVASPSPAGGRRGVTKQESQSSIRTVTATDGVSTPSGTLGRGDLRAQETLRELPMHGAGRVGSVRSLHQHRRGKSDAVSGEFVFGTAGREEDDGYEEAQGGGMRSQGERTKAAVREAEERLRELAWETMRERFEQYADEGDVIMCAMLSMIVPKELKVVKTRVARFIESYIEILTRLRLHTFRASRSIRATSTMSTTVYTTCKKCRKPILLPAAPLVHAGRPSGSFSFCKGCQASITKCSICHLPVRALMFQCPVCMHGGHQDCYGKYYTRRPPDETIPPPLPQALHRPGRSLDVVALGLSPNANPPLRGRALSRANSATAGDGGESDEGDGEGTTGSYSSARGLVGPASAHVVLARLCAAGCGHHCWAVDEKGPG